MNKVSKSKGIWFKLSEPLQITAKRGLPKIGDYVFVKYNYPHIAKGLVERVSSFTREDINSYSVPELGMAEFFTAL